eukprot:COSAG05_NODE_4995_length_1299_cov_4.111667_2_plen_60_part_01
MDKYTEIESEQKRERERERQRERESDMRADLDLDWLAVPAVVFGHPPPERVGGGRVVENI